MTNVEKQGFFHSFSVFHHDTLHKVLAETVTRLLFEAQISSPFAKDEIVSRDR